jgi:hypothetical protein
MKNIKEIQENLQMAGARHVASRAPTHRRPRLPSSTSTFLVWSLLSTSESTSVCVVRPCLVFGGGGDSCSLFVVIAVRAVNKYLVDKNKKKKKKDLGLETRRVSSPYPSSPSSSLVVVFPYPPSSSSSLILPRCRPLLWWCCGKERHHWHKQV